MKRFGLFCCLAAAGLALATVVALSQALTPASSAPAYNPQQRRPPTPSDSTPPLTPAVVVEEPAAKSIDELIARLESIKAQREALEKVERETAALLAERLKQQRQRLQKLGVSPDGHEAPPPAVAYPAPLTGGP